MAHSILLLGSGGREHALAWKLRQSHLCQQLFIAPGNAGTAQWGQNIDLLPTDFEGLATFALANDISMIVVGPEDPLVMGIVDFFAQSPKTQHIKVVGPSAAGAQLEGSKAFAKAFMDDLGIPTAAYKKFDHTQVQAAQAYLRQTEGPYVLKADGLAAGKGVIIVADVEEACMEVADMLGGRFGTAGHTVVIEQFLSGIEFSVFALTDGENYQILPIAKDYKRIGEGDTGPNTGGMGSISHPPFVDAALMEKVISQIVVPTISGLKKHNLPYKGIVFFGLINVAGHPFVIEYNCRFGDPETESVLPRLRNDLVLLFESLFNNTLGQQNIQTDTRQAATVILTAGGYPDTYRKGDEIKKLPHTESDTHIFMAGVRQDQQQLLINGGRVLAITSLADTFQAAVAKSMAVAAQIEFEGKNYRSDIGFDL